MAQDTEKLINQQIDSIKSLKAEIKGLKDEMVTIPQNTEEWAKKAEQLRGAQKKLDDINKAAKGTYVDLNKAGKDSITTLKERIKQLNQERNTMEMGSKEYKEATKSLKVLNDRLREAGTSAGDWKANVGNYANSIKGAFAQLGSAAGGALSPISSINSSLLKLAANPVGLTIMAVAGALKLLSQGITSSEDNMNKFQQILAPVKAVFEVLTRYIQEATGRFLDWINGIKGNDKVMKGLETVLKVVVTTINILIGRVKALYEGWSVAFGKMKEWADKLVDFATPMINGITTLVGKIRNTLEPAINWVIDKYNALANTNFGKKMGLVSIDLLKEAWSDAGDSVGDFVDDLNKAKNTVVDLDKARADFAKNERQRAKANASDNATIAGLDREIAGYREAMNESEDYADKLAYLQKIREKTQEQQEIAERIAQRQIASAQESLEIVRLETKETQNNAEANDKLAAAEVALTNATANADAVVSQYGNTLATLNKQEQRFETSKKAEENAKSVKALTAALKEFDAQYAASQAQNKQPLMPEANQLSIDGINTYYDNLQEFYDTDLESYREMINGKIDSLQAFIETQKALGNETVVQEAEIANLRAQLANKEVNIIAKKQKASTEQTKALRANYMQQLSAYSSLMDGMSQLFEENTVAFKATSTAKAVIDTYLAANNALAQLPPPSNYISAAAAITTGLANVASIWKVNARGEQSAPTATAPPVMQPNLVDNTPYSYTRTVTTAEEEEILNSPTKVYVLESDITNAQRKAQVRDNESSF